MNIFRIAFFIFLLQQTIYLVAAADFPLACNSDGTSCIPFNANTIDGTTWADIVEGEVEEGQYKTTQIETDIEADLWTATATAISLVVNMLYGAVKGVYSLVLFFFGSNAVSIAIGVVLQSVVYYFYAVLIVKAIKNVKGDV